MDFYTNVSRRGNKLLVRGVKNGHRYTEKVAYRPTMFLENKANTNSVSGWSTIHGNPVEPIEFDEMGEVKKFVDSYSMVSGIQVHGQNNFVTQYISDRYGNEELEFDDTQINVAYLDIETPSNDGFPRPELAEWPIVSIILQNNQSDKYYGWGTVPFDSWKVDKDWLDGSDVEYTQYDSEAKLLMAFVQWWSHPVNTPDVITGWNVKLFDMTYMINRITGVIGESFTKKLSPFGHVNRRDVRTTHGEEMAYEIQGISIMDYLDVFKKFGYTYGPQESYRLDFIAEVVLGSKKEEYAEEHDNLYNFMHNDPQNFIVYNVKDVYLVREMEKAIGLLNLAMTVAYKAGSSYDATLGTVAVWDAYIYRVLAEQKVAVPMTSSHDRPELGGGHVKEPIPGRYKWVMSFDFDSLYPHEIMQFNMSPDTIINDRVPNITPDTILDGAMNPTEHSMSAVGQLFSKSKMGFIPGIVDALYKERKVVKRSMLDAEQVLEGADKSNTQEIYNIKKSISVYGNKQMAIKIMMNALYGAMSNAYFRYFDMRIAESITASGRLAVRWVEMKVNAHLNKILKTDNVDYVIAIDTDSVYLNMEPLVNAVLPKGETQQIVRFLDKVGHQDIEPLLERIMQELTDNMGAYANRLHMSREAIAETGIWTAKKRYILSVWNNEGVAYDTPKMKIMGIEAVRSSTPAVCRGKLKDAFKIMVSGEESDMHKFIADFRSEFMKMDPVLISSPRGVNNMPKYSDSRSIYKKGTPLQVRGSLLYNHHVRQLNLHKEYEEIRSGEKIKYVYLKLPNPIKEDVISFPNKWPEKLGLGPYVDYNKQFEKVFLSGLNTVLDAIGWSEKPVNNLMGFMR